MTGILSLPSMARFTKKTTLYRSLFLLWISLLALGVAPTALPAQSSDYFPGRVWETRSPEEVGMRAADIEAAIRFAVENESQYPRDLEQTHYLGFGREPFGYPVGPFKTRGEPTGLIIRHGYIVAQWGEPDRVDMTFSVTKTFLSSTVGLAFDRGMIDNLNEPVYLSMAPVVPYRRTLPADKSDSHGEPDVLQLFESDHNRQITWDHLLRQTSDWQGTLWGKPDWADRPQGDPTTWQTRERHQPGTVYKYNDVRVNLLALTATNLWRRPLPQVLREYIMAPIDASPTWRWHGYENSWIVLDGQVVQVVSGGGHWGGGMFINAYDQARLGYLTLHRGKWKDRQILSEEWVAMALTPGPANQGYGFMNWFLNTDQERYPSAPASAFAHLGAGTNMVYVDPENDLVIVARWIEGSATDGLIQRVLAALE